MGTLLECLCPVREREVWQKEGGSWELRGSSVPERRPQGVLVGKLRSPGLQLGGHVLSLFPNPLGFPTSVPLLTVVK